MLKKQEIDKIGRSFCLLFNRATMYRFDHPYVVQSINSFYGIITEGLKTQTPLVIIMAREQVFVEEEPLDSRLNTSRLVNHLKKTGIQSVSFEQGLKTSEISRFVKIFVDFTTYPNAETMKMALTGAGVFNIKLNHVFYKKMTENDEVVSKEYMQHMSSASPGSKDMAIDSEFMDVMAGELVMEELEKALSLENILNSPMEASKTLIRSDMAASRSSAEKINPGAIIVEQLGGIRRSVDKACADPAGAKLPELAEAVFEVKRKLIRGIQAQKAAGVIYENEDLIRDEANSLTDRVLIQLIKDEYQKGATSVKRLAQILRRLVMDPWELQRLVPSLKAALIEEGMPLQDFLSLIDELGKELQFQGLAGVLRKSAEDIGVDGEALIREIKTRPQVAAELIFLAAEIRKNTGDQKILSDLFVDYVERIGCNLALEAGETVGEGDGEHLREVVRRVQSEIVDRLQSKGVDLEILKSVREGLEARMEEASRKLKADWDIRKSLPAVSEELKKSSILYALEEDLEEGEALREILEQVRSSLLARGIDENNFHEIYREIVKGKIAWQKQEEKKDLPSGVLNRTSTLFIVEKELSRANRYGSTFSALLFAVVRATLRKEAPSGSVLQRDIVEAVMERLSRLVRDTDMVGTLGKGKIMALMPMTQPKEAKTARQRILRALQETPFVVKGNDVIVKLACVTTDFDPDRTPTLNAFLERAETDLHEMVVRLHNIQELM